MNKSSATTLDRLIEAYAQLILLMNSKDDARLSVLAESATKSLEQLNHMRAQQFDAKTVRRVVSGLKQGLREMPELLASVAPDIHLELVGEFEDVLGQRFSDF